MPGVARPVRMLASSPCRCCIARSMRLASRRVAWWGGRQGGGGAEVGEGWKGRGQEHRTAAHQAHCQLHKQAWGSAATSGCRPLSAPRPPLGLSEVQPCCRAGPGRRRRRLLRCCTLLRLCKGGRQHGSSGAGTDNGNGLPPPTSPKSRTLSIGSDLLRLPQVGCCRSPRHGIGRRQPRRHRRCRAPAAAAACRCGAGHLRGGRKPAERGQRVVAVSGGGCKRAAGCRTAARRPTLTTKACRTAAA